MHFAHLHGEVLPGALVDLNQERLYLGLAKAGGLHFERVVAGAQGGEDVVAAIIRLGNIAGTGAFEDGGDARAHHAGAGAVGDGAKDGSRGRLRVSPEAADEET